MIWRSGKLKPCCYFCDINLPCILQFLQLVKLLHSLSRTGDHYCLSQDRAASSLQSVKRLHENSPSGYTGADPGFFSEGGAPLRNGVTIQDFSQEGVHH